MMKNKIFRIFLKLINYKILYIEKIFQLEYNKPAIIFEEDFYVI